MRLRNTLILVSGALLGLAPTLLAQDSHYWTMQYGPRSSLLGGAVLGSVEDVSGTYYNPGALGLARDLTFAVSANVFEYSGIALEDGGGQGVDLGTSSSGLRPSLVAGTIKAGLFGSGVLAYSALTRMMGSQDLAGYAILSGAQIPTDLQLDNLAGLVQYEGEFSDVWAGLTYSHALGSHFGLGVTWYGAFRSQRRRGETVTQGIGSDGSGAAVLEIAGGKYSTLRTLFKLGAYGSVGPVTGGLTVTTPGVHITGSGQLGVNRGTFGADTAALAASIQTDLPARFKSPLSVGFGGAWRIGGARIHASAEWYDAIAQYVVIQGEDFVSQEPEEVVAVDAVQQLDEVFNWGAGVEHAFSSRVSGYVSYYTDNSGLTDQVERASLSALPIDIQTITAGADFTVGSARFTLGIGYGWGRKIDELLTSALRQEDQEFEATFVYRSVKAIFGFEIGI